MAACQRQHPPAGAGLLIDGALPVRFVQRLQLPIAGQLVAAHGQHALGSALEQQGLTRRLVAQCGVCSRHVTVLGFEGNAAGARALARELQRVDAGLERQRQQRALSRVARQLPVPTFPVQAGVVAQRSGFGQGQQHRRFAEQLGRLQVAALASERAVRSVAHPFDVHRAVGQHHLLHRHFVAGEGAGLVGADHGDRAQRLDRRQAADHRVARGHALHADGQRDRHDGRQPLGNRRHHQPHGGHEHLGHRQATHQRAKGKQGCSHHHHGERDPARQLAHVADQRRGHLLHRFEQAADAPHFGGAGGGHHHPARLALGDQGAGVAHAQAVAQRGVGRHRRQRLLHRHRFAGQGRFVHPQVVELQPAQIGRQAVARSDLHHIAGHQIGRVDLLQPTVAQHLGVRRQQVADGLQRLFGLALLQHTDGHVEQHHRQDDTGVQPVTDQRGDTRRGQQHQDQQVVELRQHAPPQTRTLGHLQPVGAVLLKALDGLRCTQAMRRHLEPRQAFCGRRGMPVCGLLAAVRRGRGHMIVLHEATIAQAAGL